MYVLPADKKTLLDIFGKESMSSHLHRIKPGSRKTILRFDDEVILIWAREPSEGNLPSSVERYLPDVIAVRSEQMREFLAWATSVIGGYRPFTAFFRVVTPQQAALALDPLETSLSPVESALVGLIIGEALTLSTNQRSVAALSLLPCQSTYSYSFARALALGHVRESEAVGTSNPIAGAWSLARRLTRQPPRKLTDDMLVPAFNIVAALAGGSGGPSHPRVPGFVWESCREIQSNGEIHRSWNLLQERVSLIDALLNEMRGPREHRVRAFERVLKELSQNPLDTLTASFLAGALANQVAPGSFEHTDLLVPYLGQFPMALVWYGLCAGLHPDSELEQVGDCLGRRLARDLLMSDPLLSRPKYDIAVSELEVYLDREASIDFRVASQNHIAVELLPGVPAFMKWPVNSASAEASVAAPNRPPPRSQTELPLQSPAREVSAVPASERFAAVQELERAVQRVRLILQKGGGDDDAGNPKRRKGRADAPDSSVGEGKHAGRAKLERAVEQVKVRLKNSNIPFTGVVVLADGVWERTAKGLIKWTDTSASLVPTLDNDTSFGLMVRGKFAPNGLATNVPYGAIEDAWFSVLPSPSVGLRLKVRLVTQSDVKELLFEHLQ